MKLRLRLLVESDTGEIVTTEEVAQLERHWLRPEDVGLTLAEAKQILGSIQRVMVQEQLAEYIDKQSRCSDCGQRLARKGQHEIVLRTLFGELRLPSPRLYSCSCQEAGRTSFSPLAQQLQERTAPELIYLETKFAALMSYGLTVDVLSEFLPVSEKLNTRSVRRQVSRSAERMESELGEEQGAFIEGCQRDWNQQPRPDPPLTVGLDGGFVHAKGVRKKSGVCEERVAFRVLVVAIAVLVLSFGLPLRLSFTKSRRFAGGTPAAQMTLALMHTVIATVAVTVLTRTEGLR